MSFRAVPGIDCFIVLFLQFCFLSFNYGFSVMHSPVGDVLFTEAGIVGMELACIGEEVEYRYEADCNEILWTVSPNAEVIKGGGKNDNYILVRWISGLGGVVEVTTSNCVEPSLDDHEKLTISIISDNLPILGKDKICSGDRSFYFVEKPAHLSYSWDVPPFATILQGQGTNKIEVLWGAFDPSIDWPVAIHVNYMGCESACSKNASFLIEMKEPVTLNMPTEICNGTNPDIYLSTDYTNQLVPAIWTVYDDSGILLWTSNIESTKLPFEWNLNAGKYSVLAESSPSAGTCTQVFAQTVQINDPPSVPINVISSDYRCTDSPAFYQIEEPLEELLYEWEILTATDSTTQYGDHLTLDWIDLEPAHLMVRACSQDNPSCKSEPYHLIFNEIPNIEINGASSICLADTTSYSATSIEGLDYKWSLVPDSGGVISAGQGTAEIAVCWYQAGTKELRLMTCFDTIHLTVQVDETSDPELEFTSQLCVGDSTLVVANDNFSSYHWINAEGSTIGDGESVLVNEGSYSLATIDSYGCYAEKAFTIEKMHRPIVSVSSKNSFRGACEGWSGINLIASESSDEVSFQWFFNDVAQNEFQNNIQAIEPGWYHVLATNTAGCEAESNKFYLPTCEEAGGICNGSYCYIPVTDIDTTAAPCLPQGSLSVFSGFPQNCREIQFTNASSNVIPGSVLWDFGDPASGGDNYSDEFAPHHTYNETGYYFFSVIAQIPNGNDPTTPCKLQLSSSLFIQLISNFNFKNSCQGDSVKFIDASRHLSDVNINTWSWDFGDPNSGASNFSSDQNPAHLFSAPGTYEVSLEVGSSWGCKDVFTQEVTVFPLPEIELESIDSVCSATSFAIKNLKDTVGISYEWKTGDGTVLSAGEDIYHTYEQPGTYNVELMATDIRGCSNTIEKEIVVLDNLINGEIISDNNAACKGDFVQLSAPSGNFNYQWSTGENTSSIETDSAGIYSVKIVNEYGCTHNPLPFIFVAESLPNPSVFATTINIDGDSSVVRTGDWQFCPENQIQLTTTASWDKHSFEWSNGEHTRAINLLDTDGSALPTGIHEYQVTITNSLTGCTNISEPIKVEVLPSPDNFQVKADQSAPFCAKDSIVLFVENPNTNWTYQWNTGDTSWTIPNAKAGVYQAEVRDDNGCVSFSDSIEIHFSVDKGSLSARDYTFCGPDEICLSVIPDVVQYNWFKDGGLLNNPAGNSPFLSVSEDGEYQIEVVTNAGCSTKSGLNKIQFLSQRGFIEGFVWLDVNDNGAIDSGDRPMDGVKLLLNQGSNQVGGAVSDVNGQVAFSDLDLASYDIIIDQSTLQEHYEEVLMPGKMTLAHCNQKLSAHFLMREKKRSGGEVENSIFVPNAFSPNGDGVNDVFQVFPAGGVTILEYELSIYNEWGGKVFESMNPDQNWKGELGLEKLKEGVYIWVLSATIEEVGAEFDFTKRGSVSLLR